MRMVSNTDKELEYMINHVFLPPKLPQKDDLDRKMTRDSALCTFVHQVAKEYQEYLPGYATKSQWESIVKLLMNMCSCHRSPGLPGDEIARTMERMQPGDVFALLIRAQNAGIIMRKLRSATVFESFEVSPQPDVVIAAKGKLLCSYPGPAIEVPGNIVADHSFREELASFLVQMNVDVLDSTPTTRKARSEHVEERSTAHPRYITELLTGILRGMGQSATVTRIQKRIADDVLWDNAFKPWRRSSIWLLIRVALQTSLYRVTGDHSVYKSFMVFMMARVVREGLAHTLPSDLLYCMRAKISRRVSKLAPTAPDFVLQYTHETGNLVEKLLQGRWAEVQRERAMSARWAPDELNFEKDTELSLSNSRAHISLVLQDVSVVKSSNIFRANDFPRFHGADAFSASKYRDISEAFAANARVSLADFELSVQDHLDLWISKNLRNESGCTIVSSCITQYYDAAQKHYDSNPEDLSLMILTILDLWVALDKLSVAQCPLLAEYSPEIPLGLLEPLLLRRSKSLERLKSIEEYLRIRHAHAKLPIFTDDMSTTSFAVRCFESSPEHKSLLSRIEQDAKREREMKQQELLTLNHRHSDLTREAISSDHQYWVDYRGFSLHGRWCHKCSLESQANNLTIGVHEWPLPTDPSEAKATVFELQVPIVFSIWRTTTVKILYDICMQSSIASANPTVKLSDYSGLRNYASDQTSESRITIASTTKSFLNTHYRGVKIPSTEDEVCLNNGLHYKLFDTDQGIWAAHQFTNCSIVRYCTLQISLNSPYKSLQYAVDGTSHTSNQVMANQADCPRDLSLHDYIAFASLRSGPRIQWLNIARELPARSLSFKTEAVCSLITQAAWQVGPLSASGDRVWHRELKIAQFGHVLLSELEDLLQSIEGNWLEGVSARTITALTSRLLTSTTDLDVVHRAYTVLRKVRGISYQWMHQLAEKLRDCEDPPTVQEFQLRLCEIAATCRGTFDVNAEHAEFLLDSREDLAILVECGIVVYDNTPPSRNNTQTDLARLLDRDQRLSHSLESLLCERISEHRHGLDDAIAAIWPAYRKGDEWVRLDSPNDRWVTTKTAAGRDQVAQFVQFNIIEGRLLINGRPLGRLPKNIVNDPIYSRLFGKRILDIIPADMPGMDYATRDVILDHQIFFGFRGNDAVLVIRAKHESEILELIPHNHLEGDLPTLLIRDHVHWLNLSDQTIEIRPIENPWTSSDQNWRVQFSLIGRSTCMQQSASLRLIDIRSPTMHMVFTQLASLEYEEYLTVVYSPEAHSLKVQLPRLRLSFALNDDGDLESLNIPGALIDKDQSSRTFFGLSSQLVLRQKTLTDIPPSRRVLIPYGDVLFEPDRHHVNVHVDTIFLAQVRYFNYHIDSDLGRLVGDGSLMSRLYKIYLHAVTSHCLPDPLTGSTGTEEALHELSSAGCMSFQSLEPDAARILCSISNLTPDHTFYPHHLQVMQTVKWSCLSPTAQHYGFHAKAHSIMEYATHLGAFTVRSLSRQPGNTIPPKKVELLERALRRNFIFHPEDISDSSSNGDVVHASRDLAVNQDPDNERVAASISAIVFERPSKLTTCPRLYDKLKNWGHVIGPQEILTMCYSRDWLKPTLSQVWLSLYNLCRGISWYKDRFRLIFCISALAYGSIDSRDLIPTILAFATVPGFRHPDLRAPLWPLYDLANGFHPIRDRILQIAHQFALPFEDSPEASLPAHQGEVEAVLRQRRYSTYKGRLDSRAGDLADYFIRQWPCQEPPPPPPFREYWPFDIEKLIPEVRGEFLSWYKNKQLHEHIAQVQNILDRSYCSDVNLFKNSIYGFLACSTSHPTTFSGMTYSLLFQRDEPKIGRPPRFLEDPRVRERGGNPQTNTSELQSLFSEFQNSNTSAFQRRYGRDLDQSRQSLHDAPISSPDRAPYPLARFIDHRNQYRQHLQNVWASITQSLSPSNVVEEVMFTSGKWPRLTMRSLLEKLAFGSNTVLTKRWKRVLISLAQSLLGFQHSQRLLRLACIQDYEELYKELGSKDYNAQDGIRYPDWLLIQLDGNFLVRPVQTRVALEMITPTSNQNTAFQLNMGEGKSSVIVPMVAATLSDGNRFVRIVALKPLATQMFQLLVSRLSGLANRRIFYMPFSRATALTVEQARLLQDLNVNCMRIGGILVAQPEHILSFKLMGIDRLLCATSSAERQIATSLLDSQRWLEKYSRDILDESDELLYVRYQLVYTVGQQRPLEGHPDRWTTLQQVLSLVRKRAPEIQRQFPFGMEVEQTDGGGYPHIRIIRSDAGDALVSLVVQEIMNGALSIYSFGSFQPKPIQDATLRFITKTSVLDEEAHLLKEYCQGTGSWEVLLLLRGIFVHKILVYVLKERRCRVDYGLDLSRSLLAVPYKAKDVPSPRAEFGHPDVAIALTCLSYYNQGLSQKQLEQCFELLYKLDNPTLEYETWVASNDSIPDILRNLSGVNIHDPDQHRRYIFPLFHRNHAVVDFFLAQVVFPKEAKEFPKKLATSAWDLAEVKHYVTTGFSGTNDRRYILPTSITQDDPIGQLGTNARVLNYLLQPENSNYLCAHGRSQRLSAQEFLKVLTSRAPEIRILLDVGAQMLELQNAALASHWLSLRTDMSAVIYFTESDELAVMTSDGSVEPFISSPFNRQLEKCLVYLDDSHTRGTDLKFPRGSRAAVTLGPKVTKDRLLQGCMRMRKLGQGHSVMFFAPLEVDRAIREATGITSESPDTSVRILDILRWAMLETCKDIEHHVPYWAQQGIDYDDRRRAWDEFSISENSSGGELKLSWLRPESRALENMYGLPSPPGTDALSHRDVPEIRRRCEELGVLSFSDTRMEEEQEREVHHEVEREREVERPPRSKAATHQVHEDVRNFVISGRFMRDSPAFVPILSPLSRFAAAAEDAWSPYQLMTTADFSTTIEGAVDASDDYLRPVNWILSYAHPRGTLLVVLSPFEVDTLLPQIRQSKAVHLHQYTPRVTRSMKSFDNLAFYCIPPLPPSWKGSKKKVIVKLNVFAGQLYFPDEGAYRRLCVFLGLYTDDDISVPGITIQSDGFIKPSYRGSLPVSESPFKESPVPFLKVLISLRRKGMGFLSTPLGKILHGRLLAEEDFH